MANKRTSDSQDPPTYDATTQQKGAAADLDANAPPSSLHGLDLSRYRQPALVDALDRLTSFTYAGSLLLKPALKIMWRSALYQDGEVRLQELLSRLQGTSPITEPPTLAATSAASSKKQKAAKPAVQRSFFERIFHFLFVGVPLAILVGLAYGVVNFVSCIWQDILTVASTSQQLFSQAKSDLSFYSKHPESRPTKDEAVDAWTQQIIQPYTQVIVKRKLGPFGLGWISSPISRAVQVLIRRAAATSATEIAHYARKYKNFDVFRPEGSQPASRQVH